MKKVIIYSTGSCDYVSRKGSYAIRMVYKGKSKFFTGKLKDTTANRCIIQGCIEGIKNIREPCNIEFITATALGISRFKKNKGVNKLLLRELIELLNEKRCEFTFTLEKGKGSWLKEKIFMGTTFGS